MPVSGGPYLVASFFCERVLQERDGVMSFIRMVDRWNVVGATPAMNSTSIQTTLVTLFKSGTLRGSAQLTVTPVSPTGERLQPIIAPIVFEGDDERGGGLILPIGFPVTEPGLYWFEVGLTLPGSTGAVVLTNIPMRIVYLQTGPMIQLGGQPPNLG
jgi:hypothetical protein